MLYARNRHLPIMLGLGAVVTALAVAPAMAYTLGTIYTDVWTDGSIANNNLLSLSVSATVWDIVADGTGNAKGKILQNGTPTWLNFTDTDLVGKYLYSYDLFTAGTNNEDPDWFQVNWQGQPVHAWGNVDVYGTNSSSTLDDSIWYNGDQYVTNTDESQFVRQAATGGGNVPKNGGTYLSWYYSGAKPPFLLNNNWVGTLWAVADTLPQWTDGRAPNTVVPTGRTIRPLVPNEELPIPEPGTYALLALALGVPFYFRRRKS